MLPMVITMIMMMLMTTTMTTKLTGYFFSFLSPFNRNYSSFCALIRSLLFSIPIQIEFHCHNKTVIHPIHAILYHTIYMRFGIYYYHAYTACLLPCSSIHLTSKCILKGNTMSLFLSSPVSKELKGNEGQRDKCIEYVPFSVCHRF